MSVSLDSTGTKKFDSINLFIFILTQSLKKIYKILGLQDIGLTLFLTYNLKHFRLNLQDNLSRKYTCKNE